MKQLGNSQISFSVVTTVYNEADSIVELLTSLFIQTVRPKEIVVVDAGSNDKTAARIKEYGQKNRQIPINFLMEKGVNRSKGRNLGIERAKEDHIAVIDAGCAAHKHWLERFAHQFAIDPRVEVVAGFYRTHPGTVLERCFAPYLAVMPDQIDSGNYLPSSRSVAFTRKAWEKAGKYPEQLETCEDLVFAAKLKAICQLVVEPDAFVVWRLPKNWEQFFRQVRGYARGDVEAWYRPHLIKIMTVWLRYGVFVLLPPLFFLYLLYPALKFFRYVPSFTGLLLLPTVQLIADTAVITGCVEGGLSLIRRRIRR